MQPTTGPIPTRYAQRHRRTLAVTLTGWQLAVTGSSFATLAVATVYAWAVRR